MKNNNNSGFSLVEILVGVIIASVALALSIPNMTSFLYRQRLNTANREVYQAIRSTQTESMRRKENWQILFRQSNGYLEWAKHHSSVPLNQVAWNEIDPDIQLDQDHSTNRSTDLNTGEFLWSLVFDHNGHLKYVNPPAKITLQLSNRVDNSNYARRCVVIETVIGAIRVEKDEKCL